MLVQHEPLRKISRLSHCHDKMIIISYLLVTKGLTIHDIRVFQFCQILYLHFQKLNFNHSKYPITLIMVFGM